MVWYAFWETLWANVWASFYNEFISDKFKMKVTPLSQTFSIWSVIFVGLWKFLWNETLTEKQTEQFETSMRLIREWLDAFLSEDLTKALEIIKEMKAVNDDLASQFDNHYLSLYAEWTGIAAFLNESMVEIYVNNEVDETIAKLVEFVASKTGESMTDVQKLTLQWAIQGLDVNSFSPEELELFKQLEPFLADGKLSLADLYEKNENV